MNEQAIIDSYNVFVSQGYTKSLDEFKDLIATNPQALQDSYDSFVNQGYSKSIDDYKALMGVSSIQPQAEELKKKEEPSNTTELPLEGTSSASQLPQGSAIGEPFKGFTAEQAKTALQPESTGIAPAGTPQKPFTLTKAQKEELGYQIPQSETDFQRSMGQVNKELMDYDEEHIVPQLNYAFSNYGFHFNETGAGDYVEAVAPNGKRITIPVDNWTEKGDIQSSNELKAFIEQNKPKIAKLTSEYENYEKKFNTQKDINETIKKLQLESDSLNNEQKNAAAEKFAIDKQAKELDSVPMSQRNTPEYINRSKEIADKRKEIDSRIAKISQDEKTIPIKKQKLNKAVGEYAAAKVQQGGLARAAYNTMLDEVGSAAAGIQDLSSRAAADIYAKIKGIQYALETGSLTPLSAPAQEAISAKAYGVAKEKIMPAIKAAPKEAIAAQGVTEEYLKGVNEDFIKRNVLGIAGMVPMIAGTMVAPEAAGPIAAGWFFTTTYDHSLEQMDNNPAFKDVSDVEKGGVAAALGVVNAAIASKGVTHILGNSGIMSSIINNTLGKLGVETTAKTLAEAVANDIDNKVAKGVITTAASAATGALTGAELKGSELLLENTYNIIKDKKMFQTPDTFSGYLDEIGQSAADMAVGGVMMSIPNVISTAYTKNNFNGITDTKLRQWDAIANDPIIKSAYVAELKNKVISGEMTIDESKRELDALNNTISIYNSIPKDLTPAAKRKAMGLMVERKELESEIQGKDESMVKKQRERIAEINSELEKVSEMKEKPAEASAIPAEEVKPEEVPQEIASLADDENVVMTVKTLDEVPEEFRDRAEKVEGLEVTYRKKIFGLPIGEKTTEKVGEGYRYTLTGKEAKDYAIQKSSTEEGVLRAEQPELGLPKVGEGDQGQITTEEGVKPKAAGVEEEVSRLEEAFGGEFAPVSDIEAKKADIERRRQEELNAKDPQSGKFKKNLDSNSDIIEKRRIIDEFIKNRSENLNEREWGWLESIEGWRNLRGDIQELLFEGKYDEAKAKVPPQTYEERVNAKYDAELAALGAAPTAPTTTNGVSVSNKEQVAALDTKTTDVKKKGIIRAAATAIKTLKSIFPDMDIVIHDTKGSYEAQMDKLNGRKGSAGNFSVFRDAESGKIVGGRVDINLERANMRTVAHEVAHAVMLKAFGDNPALFGVFRDRISKMLSEERNKELNDFADQYSKSESPEEFLVELSAALTEAQEQLSPTTVQRIAELINKVVSKITGGKVQPFSGTVQTKELIDFLNTMSSAIGKGEEIQVKEGEAKGAAGVVSKAQKVGEDVDIQNNPVYFNNLKDFASKSSFENKIQFKKAIQNLLVSHLSELKKKYGKSFDPKKNNEATKKYLSDIITQEAVNAISEHPEAIGWYDEKTRSALDVISAIHPEIATDNEARGAFILPLAVMSNGNLVDFNFDLAEKQYDYFKKNGRFNPDGEFGLQQSGIKKSLILVNSLLDNGLSMSDINTFLTSKYRAGDLKVKINGKTKNLASGELADELVYGATILGPKIGNGFYMNLWGQFDQLTMDRWFMRTWGRLTGTLLDIDKEAISDGKKRVSNALDVIKANPDAFSILKSIVGKLSGVSIVDLAKSIEKASMDKGNRSILASNPKTDELRKASNQLSKNISGEKEAPANGSERKFIRDVFNDIKERLKKEHNIDISMADLQAVLWYPEKILYESFKGGQTFEEASEGYTSDSAPDYFNAAKKLAKKLQVNETEINEALSRGRERTQRGIGTGIATVGESIVGANKEILERVTKTIDKSSIKTTSKAQVATEVKEMGETTTVSKAQKAANEIQKVIKDARAQGYSEEAIKAFLEKKGITDVDKLMEMPEAGKKVELGEELMKGYDKMMADVDATIERGLNRNAKQETILANVLESVRKSDAYKNGTDIQKEQIEREVKQAFGEKMKTAPSVGKILGTIKDVKKVTMSEKNLLKNQIKDLARGAKDAKKAIEAATKTITESMAKLVKRGSISPAQQKTIIKRFGDLKVLSEKSVTRFVDYMTKVFADAEYDDKLKEANATKKSISKLSKNKEKNAHLRELAKDFLNIDPSMVENIDAYNELASNIKEAIKGSTRRGSEVSIARSVNIEKANEYIKSTLEQQNKKLYDEKLADVQEMMGVDASDLSYEQMVELLSSDKPITKYNEGIIRTTVNKMFDIYSTMINDMLSKSKDPFTGEDIEFSKTQRELIKRFMDMDPNKLSVKPALEAVDALANFIQNKSTAKMDSVVSKYEYERNAESLEKSGFKSKEVKIYGSPRIGRLLGEQFMTLPVLIERMFNGVKNSAIFERASGMSKLINKKAEADLKARKIVDDYFNRFYKQKANGKDFNTAENVTERGLLAFMSRTVIGTEKEMKDEFDRRKDLIEESIEELERGTDKEKQKAELYQQAYDKLLKDSENIDDVKKKADPKNKEAVEYWVEKWSDIYDELSDVSANVYNRILDRDLNYIPDRFTRFESAGEKAQLENNESVFHGNNNSLYKRKTGVLMEAERPKELPRFEGKKRAGMYIDLSFDRNNANSMYDALVDINTAATIRGVEAFINSDAFDNIVKSAKDAKVLKGRIQLFVRNMRDKNIIESDEVASSMKRLNTISSLGVGQALGGVLQPVKQVIPVALNTLTNAGRLNVSSAMNSDVNSFINNSGYSIANRGLESTTELSSINKLVDLAASSSGAKALGYIEQANKKWLDLFLVKPDVAIARASWITYYEKSLREQGIDTKGIDYSTHKLNEEAADYAQKMVDRQQNISDHDLAGKMFASKEPMRQLFVKTVMPFASFRLNQTMRMMNDISVLTSKTSSKEDKAIAARSLSGFSVEMAAFKMIAAGSAILMGSVANMVMGNDEDDDEHEKRVNNIIKGQVTGAVTDVFSPLPFLDKPIQEGSSILLDKVQDVMDVADEDKLSIYGAPKADMLNSLGTLGIAAERVSQLYDLVKLSTDGTFTDNYGKEKKVSDDDMNALTPLIGVSILSNLGLAPTEASSVVRNSIKVAKANAKGETTKTPEKQMEETQRKEETESEKIKKRDLLNELIDSESDRDVREAMKDKLNDTYKTAKEIKEENASEGDTYKELLGGYENKSDLKRYNPDLYEKNFGEDSDYYQEHKGEVEAEKKINELERQKKDEEEGYIETKKKKSNKYNLDGTIKRSWKLKYKKY